MKETKCEGMGSRESEYLIFTVKAENSPNGSTGGKEVPECLGISASLAKAER